MGGKRMSLRLVLLLVPCAVGGLLFLGIRQAAGALSDPAFCARCHVMRAQYVSHSRSAHSRVSCVACHAGQGCVSCHPVDGLDAAEARAAVNAPGPDLHALHAAGRDVACTACHQGVMHARMDGSPLAGARAACPACHLQTERGQPGGGAFPRHRLRPEGS